LADSSPTTQADNAYLEFLERYDRDPVLFVREVFGVEPDDWQIELMREVAKGTRRIAVRSGHGVGKSTVLAWVIVWHILTRFPQKTLATAPTSTQLFDALAAETKSWVAQLPPLLRDRLHVTEDRIALIASPADSFVSFATSRAETPEALAGKHSKNMLLIGDEGSGIPEEVYEAAAGSMSGDDATTILAGNPVRGSGYFYDCFHAAKSLWYTIKVSCEDCSRVSKDFIDQMRTTYGEKSNAFRVRVLGEFPLSDDDTVIPRELVDAAYERDVEPTMVLPIWGLDVARSLTGDPSALAKRKGNVLIAQTQEWYIDDTMQLVGRVKYEWDETPVAKRPSHICVDSIGLGAGVADRLREIGLPAVSVNVSESAPVKDIPGGPKYANLKAELWYKVREWLASRDSNLANDRALGEQLVKVKRDFTSTGKTAVEDKKALKKRKVPSPNRADAFVLTFAVDAVSATHGSKTSIGWTKPLPSRGIGIV
jgi:phage terminase large subunit